VNDPTLHPTVIRFIEDHHLESVKEAFAFEEGEDLVKPGLGRRRRIRMCISDRENRRWEMFMKRYDVSSLWTRIWRFLTGRRKWSEARREFETIQALRQGGVPTMRQIVWGGEQGLLAVKRSYVVVSAVPGDALERSGEEFVQRHLKTPEVIEELTDELVYVVRRLHELGFVHRDLYASHIFLHDHEGRMKLYLIDLARAFRPRWRMFRWRVKDLAQLKFSMPWVWVKLFWKRFLEGYLQPREEEWIEKWEQAIDAKVTSMARQQQRRAVRRARKEGTCESH
jgi:tRNA A-37 threonylcarbamoyl transferase component Bud32